MSIDVETLAMTTTDGVSSDLRLFEAHEPAAVIVFHSGLGVAAGYYDPFARAMAEAGHAVALVETRGVGSSSVRASRSVDFGYRELIELELPAALSVVRERFGELPCFVGGHSLGAQVAVLAAPVLPEEVVGLVLVAGGSLWSRNYRGAMRGQVRVASVVFPAVARVLGWFPGKVFGFGGRREARTLMRDWSRCADTGEYRLHGSDRDWERGAAEQTRPVLAVTIAGDEMAPKAAMAHLTGKMPRAAVDAREVVLREAGEGKVHFRWARSPGAVVEVVDPWVRKVVASRQ